MRSCSPQAKCLHGRRDARSGAFEQAQWHAFLDDRRSSAERPGEALRVVKIVRCVLSKPASRRRGRARRLGELGSSEERVLRTGSGKIFHRIRRSSSEAAPARERATSRSRARYFRASGTRSGRGGSAAPRSRGSSRTRGPATCASSRAFSTAPRLPQTASTLSRLTSKPLLADIRRRAREPCRRARPRFSCASTAATSAPRREPPAFEARSARGSRKIE